MDEEFEEWRRGGEQYLAGYLLVMHAVEFEGELIQIRKHAGLGTSGECYQCKGDKPCFIGEEQSGEMPP